MGKMRVKQIRTGSYTIGSERLTLIAGPCVLEDPHMALQVAESLRGICSELGMNFIFKSSFDKANRTSIRSYRGPGLEQGLEWLEMIRQRTGVPVLTDIHEPWQAKPVSEVADVLQIPAFLCRQTDLLVAASETGKPLNIKKAQFLSPYDMAPVLRKCIESGNDDLMLCERGTTMGYNQLVVDMRSLVIMRNMGYPVVFDATHSVQMPGGKGESSGGDRRFVRPLARAAVAIGVDALFMETHPDPENAKSDGPNMVPLGHMRDFLTEIQEIHGLVMKKIGVCHLNGTGGDE